MKYYVIGDLHLGHGTEKPMDIFGAHWERHEMKIKAAWQALVQPEDIILLPGDISWGARLSEAKPDLDWLEALPGHKICIRGNHDYWWDRPTKLNKAYETMTFLQNKAYMIEELAICGSRGWTLTSPEGQTDEDEKMIARELIRLKLSLDDGMKQGATEIWVMLHYPPCMGEDKDSPFIKLIKEYPVTKVFYGHLHDSTSWAQAPQGMYDNITYYLTAADYLGFKPLEII